MHGFHGAFKGGCDPEKGKEPLNRLLLGSTYLNASKLSRPEGGHISSLNIYQQKGGIRIIIFQIMGEGHTTGDIRRTFRSYRSPRPSNTESHGRKVILSLILSILLSEGESLP